MNTKCLLGGYILQKNYPFVNRQWNKIFALYMHFGCKKKMAFLYVWFVGIGRCIQTSTLQNPFSFSRQTHVGGQFLPNLQSHADEVLRTRQLLPSWKG